MAQTLIGYEMSSQPFSSKRPGIKNKQSVVKGQELSHGYPHICSLSLSLSFSFSFSLVMVFFFVECPDVVEAECDPPTPADLVLLVDNSTGQLIIISGILFLSLALY